jgi:hypothetical protein
MTSNNETWLIEEGDRIVDKKAKVSLEGLSTWDRLVYALWVADYGMRNAGSLDTASDIRVDFQSIAFRAAEALALPSTMAVFSMDLATLEAAYFDRFDVICAEIRQAGNVLSLQSSRGNIP